MTTRTHPRLHDDLGSSLVSFLLLAPVLVLFAELMVLGGRAATAQADVNSAAREAARDASVSAGPDSADAAIQPAVDTALRNKGFQCETDSVVLDGDTDFVAGGRIEVTVTCQVQLSDLDLLGVPGTIEIASSAVEPVDTYRVVE